MDTENKDRILDENASRDFIHQAVRDLRIVFAAFQTSDNPEITLEQLHEIVKLTRALIEYSSVQELASMAKIPDHEDATWSTRIDFKTFLSFFVNHMNCGTFGVRKREIFRVMDRDGSGQIVASELVHALESMGMRINHQEASAMTSVADSEARDGLITYPEFKDITKCIELASIKLLESEMTSPSPSACKTAKSINTEVITPFTWTKNAIALSKVPKKPFGGAIDEDAEQ